MKLMITGAGGFLASRAAEYYKDGYELQTVGHRQLDITDPVQTGAVIADGRPDVVLHCAAVSDTGACERDPERTYRVNVDGAAAIARACRAIRAKMIFCSSDQVYFGSQATVPHREDEMLCPKNTYGKQKLEAEEAVMEADSGNVCLRLSWMFAADFSGRREHGSLLSGIVGALRSGADMAYPVYDYRSITDVWDVVRNLELAWNLPGGIYNFGSENDLCTYDVVKQLLVHLNADVRVLHKNETAFSDRPRNLRMNIEKICGYGIRFPTAAESLEKACRSL